MIDVRVDQIIAEKTTMDCTTAVAARIMQPLAAVLGQVIPQTGLALLVHPHC